MRKIEPLEIKQAILREIDGAIVAVGNNRRVFPYGSVEIRLLARDDAAKGFYRAAFIDNNLLEAAIHDHLRPPRCEPTEPRVSITLDAGASEALLPNGFEVTLTAEPTKSAQAEAYIEVLEGVANHKQLRLHHGETFIGRCEHPATAGTKIVRKNDLYFLDPREYTGRMSKELRANEKINQSVSRMHAHIAFDKKRDGYYVYDDGSSKGTTLLRGGRGIAINVDRHVGKAIKNGDILCFGKAKVRFRLAAKDKSSAKSEKPD